MAETAYIADTNVYLSQWPFRRLPGDEPQQLMARLNRNHVAQAWAGSFDALLHRDLAAVNARLAADCRRWGEGRLLPFGCVNPKQPDWKEDLRRCSGEHRMMGLRLHPNYHGYGLDDPAFAELLAAAADRRMVVQIPVVMEDERTQHPLVRAGPVDVRKLGPALKAAPGAKVQLLNLTRVAPADVRELMAAGNVYTDFAMIENVHGLVNLMKDAPAGRVVFGSYYPFYYFESSLLKVKEAGVDSGALLENAKALLGDLR